MLRMNRSVFIGVAALLSAFVPSGGPGRRNYQRANARLGLQVLRSTGKRFVLRSVGLWGERATEYGYVESLRSVSACEGLFRRHGLCVCDSHGRRRDLPTVRKKHVLDNALEHVERLVPR